MSLAVHSLVTAPSWSLTSCSAKRIWRATLLASCSWKYLPARTFSSGFSGSAAPYTMRNEAVGG